MSLTFLFILSLIGVAALVVGILDFQAAAKSNPGHLKEWFTAIVHTSDRMYLSIEKTLRSAVMTLLFVILSGIRWIANTSSKGLIRLAGTIERYNVPTGIK